MSRIATRITCIGVLVGVGFSVALPEATANPPKIRFPKVKKPVTGKVGGGKLKFKPPATTSQSVSPPAPQCTIKTSELIDTRIDIQAQVSLMRKLAGTKAQRREASSMFQAIKNGDLDGIYLNWRKAVADRGALMSPKKGWWDLIPTGSKSTCLLEPSGQDPMMIFRKDLTQVEVDAALTSAWNSCGLPLVAEPCAYDVDLTKPEDDPVECKVDKDCTDAGIGDFCATATNTCGITIGPPETIKPGVKPTGQRSTCFDAAKTTWLSSVKKCQDDEFPKLAQCTIENLASPSPVGLAKCLYKAYSDKESCKRKAFDAYEHQRTVVCPAKPI